ncbi:MAG: hypothetical protein ACPGYX_04910 [Oceanobacter sp.]
MKNIFLVCLILALSACGWQLRGTSSSQTPELSPAYALIQLENMDDQELKNEIRLALAQSGMTIMRDAPAQIHIDSFSITPTLSLVDNKGIAAEYILDGELKASISHDHYQKQTISVVATERYTENTDRVMASDLEQQSKYQQIKRIAALRLVERISKLKPVQELQR